MRYVAMDFETGNSYYTSACSIGLAYYEDNQLTGTETFLIRPPESVGKFHWYNVKIHGIKRSQVKDQPTFDEIWRKIQDKVDGSVIVCHNAVFDTEVLCRCLEFYQLPLPTCRYICTVKVSQKVWPDLENHKLNTVADALGIKLNHHEAGSDAYACGEILQCALKATQSTDAQDLADKLGMQLGVISPEGRRQCSSAKKSGAERKAHAAKHHKRSTASAANEAARQKGEEPSCNP